MGKTLTQNRLQREGFSYSRYSVVLPPDVDFETVMTPEYMAHVGAQLKPFDRICFIPENGSYLADVVVTAAGRGFAKMVLLSHLDLSGSQDIERSAITNVKHGGPRYKWMVVRASDGHTLTSGLDSEADALAYAKDYEALI